MPGEVSNKRLFGILSLEWLVTLCAWVFGVALVYSQVLANTSDIVVMQERSSAQAQELAFIRTEIASIKADGKTQSRDIQRILEILERRYASP